jgi:hypothetical protein
MYTVTVFKAIVGKKIKKMETNIFRIGQVKMLDRNIFSLAYVIVVLMVFQERSNRHVIRLSCEEDVAM